MKKDQSKPRQSRTSSRESKVGSDGAAAADVGGKGDFGIPASRATVDPGGRAKGPEQGTGQTRSGTRGVRTNGVGAPIGPDGAGSGGDLDTGIIGLDRRGGVALNPMINRPDRSVLDDSVKKKPAVAGRPGSDIRQSGITRRADRRPLDTVDHSGGDVTTSGDESSESTNPEIEELSQENDLYK